MTVDAELADEDYCYVTTRGRASGRDHEIEIWFGLDGDTVYMLSGGREQSDWVRNIMRAPSVRVRIGDAHFAGRGRIVRDDAEDALARRLLLEKYTSRYTGDLSSWGRTALPVAVDLPTDERTD